MEKRNKRYLDALIIAGLLFISLLIRGTAISNVYMYVDESTYLWLTSLIFINEWTPPEEILRFSPPLFNYLLAILTILFGEKIEVLRILSVVFGSLTVCFMYLLGKALYDRKVGLLSAFFLCFSSYHCLYSRIIHIEALTLFFAVAFSYFFWMGYFRSEKMWYLVMAGIILGLAMDTKYISLFLIIAIFIVVLWVKRSFRALIDKKIAIVLIVAFLFFLPVLISLYVTGVGAYPFLFHSIKRFELPISGIASGAIRNLPIWEIIMRGIKDYLSILTYGYQNIPFYHLFRVSALILIPITFLFHAPQVIRAKHAESFIIALILSIGIIVVGSARHKYYLLYILPFYFILLSNLAIKAFSHLSNIPQKRIRHCTNIFSIFIVLLVGIMCFSYVITGVMSPGDRGESVGLQVAMEYIEDDIVKEGRESVIISSTLWAEVIEHYIHLDKLNAASIFILTQGERQKKKIVLDMDKIRTFKPDYIIASESEYKGYFSGDEGREIFENYRLLVTTKDVPLVFFVLKRIDEYPKNLTYFTCDECKVEGKICPDTFSASVPGVMTVGKRYTALVKIKNTGNLSADYTVSLHAPTDYIFVEDTIKYVTIDEGSVRTVEFGVVPLRECSRELLITAELYLVDHKEDEYKICMLDGTFDSIYIIKKII